MEVIALNAQIRKGTGKGVARRLRAEGSIPAVLYGSGSEATLLELSSADFIKLLRAEKGEAGFIKLVIQAEGRPLEKLSMIKELQTNAADGTLVHADFYEIRMDHKLTMDVPIRLAGRPIGVEMGGEIHQFKRDLKISCLPGVMPKFVEIDISGLDIGKTFRVADLALQEGIEAVDPEEAQIVAVAAKKAVVEVEKPAEEEGPKEPEVITEKKGAEEESE